MGTFVQRVLRPEQPDWIIRSLLDVDFYKFTMGQFVHRFYAGQHVTFGLINRDKEIKLAHVVDENELRAQLDHVRALFLRQSEIAWLRGMDVYGENMFSNEYLEFLRTLQLSPYELSRVDDQYRLLFSGPWEQVTFWETIALAIISELYYRSLMKEMSKFELEVLYGRAKIRLWDKLQMLRQFPGIRFADFGQRRRHSFLWQDWVVQVCADEMGEQFTGTSNTLMAMRHNLMPIGTNAHELPMVATALAKTREEKRSAQYEVLKQWQQLYGDGLRICLPDTYGTVQFLKDAPSWIANDWRGMRQDSGDPIEGGRRIVRWYEDKGIDPKEKLLIPSDGLDVGTIIHLHRHFEDVIQIAFGWGTLLTNDFVNIHPRLDGRFRPFSLVCKITEAGGHPAVKLSDNIGKATGPAEEIERYIKIFGQTGRSSQAVVV